MNKRISPLVASLIAPAKNVSRKVYAKQKYFQRKIVVTTVAGDGTAGFKDGPALRAKLKNPLDVAVLHDGTIFIADGFNSCIRRIIDGQLITFAGNGNANVTNGKGKSARFKIPSRLASDAAGNLYTLDAADPRIRKITAGGDVSIHAGTHTFGFKDGKASKAQFGQSFGVATDVSGNIYVADSQNDRIRRISVRGEVSTVAGTGIQGLVDGKGDTAQFYFATGIAIDRSGNLFVSDASRIRKITPDGMVSTFAGTQIKGYEDGKSGTAQFSHIEGIAIDDHDNIYVSDGHRIRKISPQGVTQTIAGAQAGFEDGDAGSAKFDSPQGLATDSEGNIYVADFNNNRIRKISFL